MDGLTSNNSLIIFSNNNLTIDATGLFLLNSVMECNEFVKYRPPLDFLNPPSANCLAAVGYVDQEITNAASGIETKTQNISDLTIAGETKYSGDHKFYGHSW